MHRLPVGDLIAGAREGKDAHVGELRRRFGPAVYASAFRAYPRGVSEIVDDVFLKLPELLQRYDDRERFQSWIVTVALNVVRSRRRDDRRRLERQVGDSAIADLPVGGRSPGKSLEFADLRERLLEALDERQRTAWEMFESGHPHREIAEALGVDENNSQQIVYRAKQKLRVRYRELTQTDSSRL
jgi:RNA polymerase sigma factor (sigma-70 family)